MGVKIYGVEPLVRDLERLFGKSNIAHVVDEALISGSLIFAMELRRQLRTFSDGRGLSKGYTFDELTLTAPEKGKSGSRAITVYWRGPHQRYRLIHLNEWGTLRNPKPNGFGRIAVAMENARLPYGRAVRDAIRKGL